MSTRSGRPILRLDYKIMHESGEKVEKVTSDIEKLASEFKNIPVMSQSKALGKARNYEKVVTEISDHIEMNDLEEMKDIELIDDYTSELTDLLRTLRDKYEVMQDTMSNDDYEIESYKHDELVSKVKLSIKKAKSVKIHVKKEEREKEETIRQEKEENIRKEEREKEEKIRKEAEAIRKEEREKEEKIRKEAEGFTKRS